MTTRHALATNALLRACLALDDAVLALAFSGQDHDRAVVLDMAAVHASAAYAAAEVGDRDEVVLAIRELRAVGQTWREDGRQDLPEVEDALTRASLLAVLLAEEGPERVAWPEETGRGAGYTCPAPLEET